MSIFKVDILILGSGVAGLTSAIKIAKALPDKKVWVVTKAEESESNTKYAQGGVAAVWDELDTFKDHISDTMIAGDFLNDPEVVKMVIEEAPAAMNQLMDWGANFDENKEGELDLGKEGGHSAHRIIHHKDITGFEIERTLLHQVSLLKNITVLPFHFAIDLITNHHIKGEVYNKKKLTCFGAYILNQKTNQIDTYLASKTILCAGGIGQVYASTTNPNIATGDGVAMAYRAKAIIEEMEFVQFHPTALFEPGESPAFLISEAVRGFGAYLRNKKGERFMLKVDERAELAPRDIVARAIDNELNISGERCVYLDCTHLDYKAFLNHFPNINDKCLSMGIDIRKSFIPVVPACHYLCGGVSVTKKGETSIFNLFACGECSRTGLHGANRLASNSLLEALVYADHISKEIIAQKVTLLEVHKDIPEWNEEGTTVPEELVLITHNKHTVQSIMSDLVAIVRTNDRLQMALDHLDYIYQDTEKLYAKSKLSPQVCELRNLNAIAYLIVKQSIVRKENKGAYYNLDYV